MDNRILKHFFLTLMISLLCSTAFAKYNKDNAISAARGGDLELIQSLLQERNNKNNQALYNNILAAAIMGKQDAVVEFILDKGADINHISSFKTSLLINTIMNDRTKYSKLLISRGVKVNVRGYDQMRDEFFIHWDWTALMCASYVGDLELVKSLVAAGADTQAIGWSLSEDELESSADIAAYSGNLEVFKYLNELKVPVHEHTIFKVVRGGHLNVLEYMLPFMKDINQPGPFKGRTLLIEAAWWGHADIVQYLIDQGADINSTDTYGYTAVSEVTDKLINDPIKQLSILEILIQNGADLNLPSYTNIRPYDRAVKYGNEEIRLYLKENGAEPTLLDM